ncbi:MAG: protein kinase domain-containing protein, partial [Pirellula sp.]
MGSSDDPTPSVEIFKQLALTCEEIEVAVRSGQNVDLETYVASFPLEYQDLIRPELEEVLAELRVPTGKKTSYPPDAGYEALHEYSVLDQIAQGGMGRVLIAWDERFSRQVALKEIHPHSADDQRYRKRFLQESLITARLEHPGILPIYSLGVNSDDQPFYTMRLVSGQNAKTLRQAIRELHENSLDISLDMQSATLLRRQLLGRLIDVCNTVAYAHSQGVCHRDLKPANILLGPFGETLVV